jgi:hypothetical protein
MYVGIDSLVAVVANITFLCCLLGIATGSSATAESHTSHRRLPSQRSLVQSCLGPSAEHEHGSAVTGQRDEPILAGGRFLRRFHRSRSRFSLRVIADRKTAEEGCVHGDFDDPNTLRVMLLADGYSAGERALALQHVRTAAEALSEEEPFKRYKGFIAICYRVMAADVSGVSALGTEPNCGGVRRALCTDPNLVHAAGFRKGVRANVFGVLYNSLEYYGAAQFWDGIFAVSRSAAKSTYNKPLYYWVAMHEFFHACCISPFDTPLRNYPTFPVSRFDNKIQDEYPTGSYQCDSSRAYNLSKTEAGAPWSYALSPDTGFVPFNLENRLCAYKATETSIMFSFANVKANVPTEAGWIRQLFSLLRTVTGIRSSHRVLAKDGTLTLVGAGRLPYPVVDWFVNDIERAKCRNKVVCNAAELGLKSGPNTVRARVGVADPAINSAELEALTDTVTTTVVFRKRGANSDAGSTAVRPKPNMRR